MTTKGTGRGRAERYPMRTLGLVAEVNGITSGRWMTAHFAALLSGADARSLGRWAKAGFLSFRQERPGGPLRYLRPEIEILSTLRRGQDPMTLYIVRQYVRRSRGEIK
ncbi:hypothetical protein AGRA3207_000205 [Actinomadura graeca]|uniref:Helix-turn-helix domain-containing protein n=1 Tax=Actinomadura graeca TaxID=2750812 RepID=A0ABX8QPI2_9ACTN|nr:hypothetical protein [Actinomadura graeca]QXJ19642.1 hypothetical protein AGRA3207_000205 [Actinomadura graeca]